MTILCLVPGFRPPSSLLQPGRRLSWIPNNLAIIGLLEGAKCGCGAGVDFVFLMKDYKIWAEVKCRLLRMQSEFDMRALPVDKSRKGKGKAASGGAPANLRCQGDAKHERETQKRNCFSICNVVCWKEYKTRVRWTQLSSQL